MSLRVRETDQQQHQKLTLANDIESQPIILGIAAIIRDCQKKKTT